MELLTLKIYNLDIGIHSSTEVIIKTVVNLHGSILSFVSDVWFDFVFFVLQLQTSGLLGSGELNVGTAIACFLAQDGADINYANHKGKTPLDLVSEGRTVQLVKSFAEKFR